MVWADVVDAADEPERKAPERSLEVAPMTPEGLGFPSYAVEGRPIGNSIEDGQSVRLPEPAVEAQNPAGKR